MFIDIAKVHVTAGKGGDGCVSTRREKYVPRGGPDGGNGGQGGSVYVVATSESSTLLDFRYRRRYQAEDGRPGGGRRKTGADGNDLEIPVPCGTSVLRIAEGEDEVLIGDLLEPGQRLLVARSGRGGKGNWEFRSARNQTPMKATEGRSGEACDLRLELKLIADIGLVGAPNAGKSTLLSVLTAARPKVADYPFTTLIPNLGIVDLGDFVSCTLADIPGLIDGASEGKGLGHEFLRHIERTRALLLMVDPSTEAIGPALDMLMSELNDYGHGLPDLPRAVALTKRDLIGDETAAEHLHAARLWADEHGVVEVIAFSAVASLGLAELRHLLRRLYRQAIRPLSIEDSGTEA